MEQIYNIASTTVTYLDAHQGLLTIAGWIVLLWLGLYHSKQSLKNEVRLKIYEDLLDAKNGFDKSFCIDLALKTSPFELKSVIKDMENFDADKKYLITKGIFENSYIYWNVYFRELTKVVGDSHEDLLRYYNRLERWLGVIPDLKEVRDLWFRTSSDLYKKLWNYNSTHLATPIGKKDEAWKEDALRDAEALNAEVHRFVGYTEDLNILVHDYLLSPIFKYKKRRRDLSFMEKDLEYTALTKRGFVQQKYKAKKHKAWFRNMLGKLKKPF
jgi:hypothetical protein